MDETLIKKLTAIVESQKQLEDDLSKVDISSDPNKYAEMAKKHSDMSSIVELFRQWETLTSDISDAEELLNDCLLYTSPSPRDIPLSRMPSSA